MVDNLERIKMDFSEYETCHGLYTEDVKWLIEQAEKQREELNIREKLSKAWELLYDARNERNAPYDKFNDDPIANILFHAMHDIKEAYKDLENE
jgi:hypothetical protein